MTNKSLLSLVRDIDEATIRQRLAELDGEYVALKALLRSVVARNRVGHKQARANKGVAK